MPWFKVDDQFHSHPKMRGLDMAARGLWVTAGSWCASYLTDGEITEREVKALGGTRRQAEKLVSAGLWDLVDDSPGARRYAFHDWAQFQPTRAETTARRQRDAERKAEARAAKAAKQGNVDNVRSDTPRTSERSPLYQGNAESALPGPARPDPTHVGTTSQPSNGEYGDGQELAGPTLDELADATRRARQAGISDTAITAGTRRFNERPGPKGPGLLRTLINDEWEAEQLKTRIEADRRDKRAAIANCPHCDQNGMRDTGNGLTRCKHRLEAPQAGQQDKNDQTPIRAKPTPQNGTGGPY